MIAFADSTSPARINPDHYSHVAGYANGKFAWTDEEFARFKRYFKIGVFAGQPDQARIARCLDVERFDATPADVRPFVEARRAVHPKDALIYCNLSTLPDVLEAAGSELGFRFWLAWWWGRDFPPTAADVLAEIHALTGVTLPGQRLWGVQWQNGAILDRSVSYAKDNFSVSKP